EVIAPAEPLVEARRTGIVLESARDVVAEMHEHAAPSDDVLVAAVEAGRPALGGVGAPPHQRAVGEVALGPGRAVVGQVETAGELAELIEMPLHGARRAEDAEVLAEDRTGLLEDVLEPTRAADDEVPRGMKHGRRPRRDRVIRSVAPEIVAHGDLRT